MMRVVIVGGGFGGIRAALNLANRPGFDVTLVSDKPYFEYKPALYRSATGRSLHEVAISLADFFSKDHNIRIVEDEIIHIDSKSKHVAGRGPTKYHYDVLILAVGTVTQYFNIKGLADFSYGADSIRETLGLKKRLHEDLVAGGDSERNYVVIGGGATGIELAGELVGYLRTIRRKHHVKTKFNVELIEASTQLMPNLPPKFTTRIKWQLEKLGVKVRLNTPVRGASIDEVELPTGSIKSRTVVWTSGVTNNPLFVKYPKLFTLGRANKVVVDECLAAQPDIYVIGDSAATQYSGMAQTAIYDASFVTANLIRSQNGKHHLPYRPNKPIFAIPAGPTWAAVLWGKAEVYGFIGWLLRRLADLRLYLSFLPINKAFRAWHAGFITDESCPICKV